MFRDFSPLTDALIGNLGKFEFGGLKWIRVKIRLDGRNLTEKSYIKFHQGRKSQFEDFWF